MNIPENFPRKPDPAALAGAHPKVAVRLINVAYVGGYTKVEIEKRYEVCTDLVTQLTAYYHRKKSQSPSRTHEQLLAQMTEALGQKNWGLSAAEIAWCMTEVQLAVEFGR